jgi:thymidine kinase
MSLDIILGPMFAGKSSHILSLVSRHAAIGTPVLVIKHLSDTRYVYSEDNIVTHDQRRATCASVQYLGQVVLRDRIKDHQVIIVDEAQFFPELVEFVKYVVEDLGKNLYLVGLDGDIHRSPFGEMLECIPLADRIVKLTSFCHSCADGTPGLFSYRSNGEQDQRVIIGGRDMYESLCRACYLRRNKEESRAQVVRGK